MSSIITHRITTSKHTNIIKKNHLKAHFEHVKMIKNYFSQEVSKVIHTQGLNEAKKIAVSKEFIASLNNHPSHHNDTLTIWEEQKLLKSIMDFYVNHYAKYLDNKSFVLSTGLTKTTYKKTIKNKLNQVIHEKGSLKSYDFTFKKSYFNSLLNYFKYANLNVPLNVFFSEKDSEKTKERKEITG